MLQWIRTLRASLTRPPLDIDAVRDSAPFGSLDCEIEELSRRVTKDEITYAATEPLGLLDSNVIVIVLWSKQPHVHLFDGSGRYIAIVADRGFPPRSTAYFMEAGGCVFSIHPVPANMTTLHGKPSAVVTAETNGRLIGTWGENREGWRLRGVGFRGSAGELLATVERSGFGSASQVVLSSDGQELARLWSGIKGKTPTRRYLWARVIRFEPDASAEIRALTLAHEHGEGLRSLFD
jgi:hypothetical protein